MQTVVWIGQQCAGDEECARLIQREGFQVMRAANGTDGLAAIRNRQPTLVIVDHQLPEPGGLQVLKEVRAARPDCDVALVTSGGELDDAVEVLRAGAIDYLRRPVNGRHLRRALSRARARNHRRNALRPPTILVLDDHQPTLNRLTQVLRKEGYKIYARANGREGMRLLDHHSVDLILADVRMPVMGGLSVLRETKSRGADVEVMVMTGCGDEDSVIEALRHGAVDFLLKPVDLEHLLGAIERALEGQARRRGVAHREQAVELMRQLVFRLTKELEIIVEPPKIAAVELRQFGRRLLDAVPLSVLVADSECRVVFANRHAEEHFRARRDGLVAADLRQVASSELAPDQLDELVRRTINAVPGTIEHVTLGQQILVMTPLKLVRTNRPERFVALAVCGQHPSPDDPAKAP